jgi:arylsulfatase A-like enzyme
MPARPNVLVFFTDQQRWDTCGCYGCPMDLTPNLDAMARRGVQFLNAFTCQPVCAPARGSLQTGRHATAHGVWRNGLALPTTERTLAHCFGEAGYDVGYLGKWHLAGLKNAPVPREARSGYDGYWEGAELLEFSSHPYDARWWDADDREVCYPGYRVDAQTNRAIDFVRQERDRPFFFFISYLEPHFQNDMHAFVGPDEYRDTFKNPWVPQDLQNRPGDWYESLPGYYGCVKSLDDNLGRLLGVLEERGVLDDTLVVFTSDHGCHFRTRNGEYKRSCHESSIRIPLVMQGPGLDVSRVVPELVSLVDLPTTILAAAGLPAPEAMHGRDATVLVRGENRQWANEVFVQISESEVGRAIRTERWKYSVYAPEKGGWQESSSDRYVERYLYDLWADPHESVNLIGRKDYDPVRADLKARLVRQMVAAGESEPEIVDGRYYE